MSIHASANSVHTASFRDPSGFIFHRDGVLYRQVNPRCREDYDLLMGSGLYQRLVDKGQLVAHEEVDLSLAWTEGAYKVLRPAPVPFISYPYEWSFSQLKDAALLTLSVQKEALELGLALKDASAYNVQFVQGRPQLIDTLSFTRYVDGEPWVAYRQFCQHFLAPLALMARVDIRLGKLLALFIDGVPLDMAASMLPSLSKWTLGLGLHIHAHAKSQRKYAAQPDQAAKSRIKLDKKRLQNVIIGLEMAVEKESWNGGDTEWADYYDRTHNYGETGLDSKAAAVKTLIEATGEVRTGWDLGANVGRFSRLLSEAGARTVAWDIDPSCVEWNYRQVREKRETHLLPLLLDLTNPSAGIGWAHQERESLQARGPVDVILALGLIHHLVIGNNVPVSRVAAFLADLCTHLIIEFVPKEDSQVKLLLATREDIFDQYVLEPFAQAMGEHFEEVRRLPIEGTCRTLFLLRSRHR